MATVSGTILLPSGLPRAALITFKPLSTPYLSSESLVTSQDVTVTSAADGTFSVALSQGDYQVTIGADQFDVTIPGTAGPFILDGNIITTELSFMPPASNTNQGTFAGVGADFVLPANPVNFTGAPVATGMQQTVYGPGKFQIEVALSILTTSRNTGAGAAGDELYTAYIWDATNNVQIGIAQTVGDIYTGTSGQMILRGTLTIAGATNVLLAIYAAGNTGPGDVLTASPNSVGTIQITKSTISIARLP